MDYRGMIKITLNPCNRLIWNQVASSNVLSKVVRCIDHIAKPDIAIV
jgi:hypothetical protein